MPLPVNVNTGTVTGTFTNDDGSAASGRVIFTPDVDRLLNASADVVVVLRTHVVTLNASGAFSQVLVATDDVDLNPLNWTWTVREEITDKPKRHYAIAVPAGTTRNLADISPVPQSDGVPVPGDGDKGDIVVSSFGTVWMIDSGVLTTAGRALIDDATAAAQVATLGLTAANNNTRLGVSAQQALTTGGFNTAMGFNSQYALTTGSYNTTMGVESQSALTSGYSNTAVGFWAQRLLTTGYNNVVIGMQAQQAMTTGNNNTGVGYVAQAAMTTGGYNVAVGTSAQTAVTTGGYNVATGAGGQQALTTGNYNVAVGGNAQQVLTTGTDNVAVGTNTQNVPGGVAANATTTALHQTSVGSNSGLGSAVQHNDITTIGYYALASGVGATSVGAGAHAAFAGSVALGLNTVSTAIDQVHVGTRDIEIDGTTKGVVMKSPDGLRWRLRIANGGTVTIAAA